MTGLSTGIGSEVDVYVDTDRCMGAAQCISLAPAVFEMNENSQAYVKISDVRLTEEILTAQRSCPNFAIRFRRDFSGSAASGLQR